MKYEGVWFRYPNAPERGWVLQDIDFTVEAGRSLAVVEGDDGKVYAGRLAPGL